MKTSIYGYVRVSTKDQCEERQLIALKAFVMEVAVTDLTPVSIIPADITIYTGGSGHYGVVAENENIESSYLENGFPEPGFSSPCPKASTICLAVPRRP